MDLISGDQDGKRVIYVDGLRLQHSGVIVGQSVDGQTYYVRSDRDGVPDAPWHFTVAADSLPGVLVDDE